MYIDRSGVRSATHYIWAYIIHIDETFALKRIMTTMLNTQEPKIKNFLQIGTSIRNQLPGRSNYSFLAF